MGRIIRIPTDEFGWAKGSSKKIITHPLLDIVTEYDESRWVNVKLAGKPYVDVVLDVEADIGISPSSLTFTQENWDQNQKINLLADGAGTVDISGDKDLIHSDVLIDVPEASASYWNDTDSTIKELVQTQWGLDLFSSDGILSDGIITTEIDAHYNNFQLNFREIDGNSELSSGAEFFFSEPSSTHQDSWVEWGFHPIEVLGEFDVGGVTHTLSKATFDAWSFGTAYIQAIRTPKGASGLSTFYLWNKDPR